MYEIFVQYHREETTIGVENVQFTELQLPVITLCSDVAFKRKIQSMNVEEYLNVTFGFEELFPDSRE